LYRKKQREGEDDKAVNFDSEFTSERPVESFAKNVKDEVGDSSFDGFDFEANPKNKK